MRLRMANRPSGLDLILDEELALEAGFLVGGCPRFEFQPSTRGIRIVQTTKEALLKDIGREGFNNNRKVPSFCLITEKNTHMLSYIGWLSVFFRTTSRWIDMLNYSHVPHMTMSECGVISVSEETGVVAEWPKTFAPPRTMAKYPPRKSSS